MRNNTAYRRAVRLQLFQDILSGIVMVAFLGVFGGAAIYYADRSAVHVVNSTVLEVGR